MHTHVERWKLLIGIHIFFFFNDTATTEIYTLSLHDALPICRGREVRTMRLDILDRGHRPHTKAIMALIRVFSGHPVVDRSEEHTSELQSPCNLVCRLLLEKKQLTIVSSSLITHLPQQYCKIN